ncbi:MAG: hypothetical protein LBS36_13555 [Oscillospiraceae bacterium]|jgi:hypothetical protein|nr:hypothetical protein [Oscillospiraceae bacterium]
MDNRTPEQRERARMAVERSIYIDSLSKNRRNRLEQYQKTTGRELTLEEIKVKFGG